jgi:hypothetical protein
MSAERKRPNPGLSLSARLSRYQNGVDPEEEQRFADTMRQCRELRQELDTLRAETQFDLAVIANGGAGNA